jgi:upstream activation factor subunit UAF30
MTEPTDDEIRTRLQEILPTVNLEETGLKKFMKLLSAEFGGIDLKGRKSFIKEALTEAMSNQEEEDEEDSGDEDEDEDEDSVDLPTPTKKKRGGGLAEEKEISPALQAFLQKGNKMSRTEIVKSLWEYIHEHNLQNPSDKREIILDDALKKVFKCETFTMFTMNKYIGAHIHPFKPVDLTPTPRKKRKVSKQTPNAKKARKAGTQPPYRLSDALAAVTGASILPRPQVVSKIWDYIRANGLQNPNDKREILCDDKLKPVMGNKAKVNMFKMNTFISDHLIEKVDKNLYKHESDSESSTGNDSKLSSETSSEDDSLVLEGVLIRNPDVSSSEDEVDSDEDAADTKPKGKIAKQNNRSKEPEIDTVHVEFVFCDMAEDYWHGIKALLSNSSSLYQAQSSGLADQSIEWDMVGTIIGQPNDPEHTVYGFGSLLHWTHFPEAAQSDFAKVCSQDSIGKSTSDVTCQARVSKALQQCQEKASPAVAVLLTGRMINLPVEIVLSLHQQLWLDITWAQKQTTKLSYSEISTVLCFAPCTRDSNDNYIYRYFEDELLVPHAKGSYVVKAPQSYSREDQVYLHILEMNLDGYKSGIESLETLVSGR